MSDEQKKSGQLHELLAVESDLKGQAGRIQAETEKRFKRNELFRGSHKQYTPFNEADDHLKEEDHEELGTTVEARLKFTADKLSKYWDAVLQKEATNQTASADLVFEGEILVPSVPATMLLGLEKKLKQFRDAIDAMPTLDMKTAWIPAGENHALPHVFRSKHVDETLKSKKIEKPIVLYEAVVRDGVGIPANVEMAVEDVPVGKWKKTLFSGAVTSARAAEILDRTDAMLRAVKKARQRANKAPIVKGKIGEAIFGKILA